MRRVAVKIAYSGRDFCGSQYQPGLRTVVGDIMEDLQKISPGKDAEWFDVKPSSRTDTGVNALENVIAVNTEFKDNITFLKALNSVSDSIFYRAAADVDDSFNPRFADARVYRYIIPSEGLDAIKVKECSRLFIGEHDFVRFCKIYEEKTTVTDIKRIDIRETDGYIELTFESRFFLWNMIRKISAALISVGRGERTMDEVKRALNGEDVSFGIARPDALTLMNVKYSNLEFEYPESDAYLERLNEEKFRNMLRENFLSSL